MKHILTLMATCMVSLSMQAQQSWNFGDLSESTAFLNSDTENWAVDKYKNETPSQWHNTFTTTDWTTLQAGGQDIPATKGLLFNGITKANAVVFSTNVSKQNYFKFNSKMPKIKISNLTAGQKVTITGITGSDKEARGFTAEENLAIESGFETSLDVQTNTATVVSNGDVVIGCTGAINIYSIEVTGNGSTGIAQTSTVSAPNMGKTYSLNGIEATKGQKGILITNGKKFTGK